jgi:hypothetical protein
LHNYTLLAKLVGTEKNKQLHYQTNANSHLPRKIHFLYYKIIGTPKQIEKLAAFPYLA